MYGYYVAYMLHKSIGRVLSVRRDKFCHRITKFCMFCPFSPITNPFAGLTKPLESSKCKEFTYDNFEFDEHGTKFSVRVENTMAAISRTAKIFSKDLYCRHRFVLERVHLLIFVGVITTILHLRLNEVGIIVRLLRTIGVDQIDEKMINSY